VQNTAQVFLLLLGNFRPLGKSAILSGTMIPTEMPYLCKVKQKTNKFINNLKQDNYENIKINDDSRPDGTGSRNGKSPK